MSSGRRIPRQPEVNIGTAGHVDHGKTTLVEALTGKWTSAHSEELRRGITIKVGYADAAIYRCTGCDPPAAYNTDDDCAGCGGEPELRRVVSFVDCPGHESLMANMLSGASAMDGAVLVVAANEPIPQPQTREHLQALRIVGVERLVVALNKIDLVSWNDALSSYEKLREFLEEHGYGDDVPVIPTSAQRRLNIDALVQAIEEHIPTPPRDRSKPPMMQVLRSFDVNKPGTELSELKGGILGGTLMQGVLRVGDEVELRPGIFDPDRQKYFPVTTKVVSLGTSAGLVDSVEPGGLIAVGTELDPFFTKGDQVVGDVMGPPGELPDVVDHMVMDVELLPSVVGATVPTKVEPLRKGEPLRLNVGTMVTLGIVSEVKGSRVSLSLRRPVCPPPNARVAISRRIEDRWRLVGSGRITG
ncbi:MAG: translation initiation factor IF-2 subunit gamma [Conexivisphaera sp.]